jgi:hypothetical protein
MLLPREGTLVSVTANLGRTLLLVEFGDGQHEYLFEHEVELKNGNTSQAHSKTMVREMMGRKRSSSWLEDWSCGRQIGEAIIDRSETRAWRSTADGQAEDIQRI